MYKDEKFILLPEIQFEYALLDFKDIIIPRKVKRMLKQHNYILTINERFNESNIKMFLLIATVCISIGIYM